MRRLNLIDEHGRESLLVRCERRWSSAKVSAVRHFGPRGRSGVPGASDPRSAFGRMYGSCQRHRESLHQRDFGYPDDLKFHSSVTLFAKVAEDCGFDAPVFKEALKKHFANRMDEETLRQLRSV